VPNPGCRKSTSRFLSCLRLPVAIRAAKFPVTGTPAGTVLMRAAGLAAAIHLYPIGPPQAVSATPPSSASSGRNRCGPVIAVARPARTGPVPRRPAGTDGGKTMDEPTGRPARDKCRRPHPASNPRDSVPFNRCAVAVEHAAEHADFMHVDSCQLRMIGVNQAIRCGFCQSRTPG
jgi:hypothetical protein